jgi:hypothetical protein
LIVNRERHAPDIRQFPVHFDSSRGIGWRNEFIVFNPGQLIAAVRRRRCPECKGNKAAKPDSRPSVSYAPSSKHPYLLN